MNEKDFLEYLHDASRETGYELTDDDAAVTNISNVISTDQFIEGTHFLWDHMDSEKLGYKAVVQSLSDLAAMAAQPTAVLSSMAWNSKHIDRVAPFITGMKNACLDYAVPLVGGDISGSRDLFYADITVAGFTNKPLLKSGSRPGDYVVVTGTIGDARAGLECVSDKNKFPELTARYEKPTAHIELILKIVANHRVHAGTDISDSLSKSLFALGEHSRVGFIIDNDQIPVSIALEAYVKAFKKNIDDYKWNAGEDYQLLLTLPANISKSVFTDYGLTAIGRVTEDRKMLRKIGDRLEPLTEVGWDPFAL